MKRNRFRTRAKPGPKRHFTDRQLQDVIDLVGKAGARDVDLANYFQVDRSSIDYWKNNYPDFKKAYHTGKMTCAKEVVNGLYMKATGFRYPSVKFFKSRVRDFDEEGNVVQERDEIIQQPYLEYIPPDTAAAVRWLSVNMREVWSEAVNVTHNHNVQGEVNHKFNEIPMDHLSEDLKNMVLQINKKQIKEGKNNN